MSDPHIDQGAAAADAHMGRFTDLLRYWLAVVSEGAEAVERFAEVPLADAQDRALRMLYRLESTLEDLVMEFGDPLWYSDGRMVFTEFRLPDGSFYLHIWLPIPSVEPVGRRAVPCKDEPLLAFEIETVPATQEVRVRKVPIL